MKSQNQICFCVHSGVVCIGMKSKVDELKAAYDREECPCLEEYDPHTVASLLKQYLRELPDNLLGKELVLRFEEACGRPSEAEKLQEFQRLLGEVPSGSRLLLAWLITHMDHVIAREIDTKMNIQNISIVLNPTVQVSLVYTGDVLIISSRCDMDHTMVVVACQSDNI